MTLRNGEHRPRRIILYSRETPCGTVFSCSSSHRQGLAITLEIHTKYLFESRRVRFAHHHRTEKGGARSAPYYSMASRKPCGTVFSRASRN
jgi:hypothetical protein